MGRISFEQLVDLAEGRLPAAAAAELRIRISADPDAQAELGAIEELISLMRDDESVDAPEHVIRRAVRLMSQPSAPQPAGVLQRLIAVVTSDSMSGSQLAVGLRTVQAWPRALLLTAGDRELDLQIEPSGERWQLHGQVLGPEEPGTVTLIGEGVRVSTPLNSLGEFALPAVVTGRYVLSVIQGSVEVIVPELELGPSSRRS
jgi:anti-sigma factor RsiW